MASIEELLRYLEQFMTGHLNQQSSHAAAGLPGGAGQLGSAGLPRGGEFAGGGGGGVPSAGGVPSGAGAPGGPGAPGGAMAGESAAGAMAGESQPQPPPGLANASQEEVQEALLQFAAMHPELAPFFTEGRQPFDLGGALTHLAGIPPEALTGFTPAPSEPEFGHFGGLAADEIGQWVQAEGAGPSFAEVGSNLASEPASFAGATESAPPPIGDFGLLTGISDPGFAGASGSALDGGGGFDGGHFSDLTFPDPTISDPTIADPTFADPTFATGEFSDPSVTADGLEATMPAVSMDNDAVAAGLDGGPDPAHDGSLSFSDAPSDPNDQF
jgi:hypothetical protein